ncbi:hypothetical protein [Komagataeibacter rhaeticus]|nr:hypothetical protein [Komagataeibacter rhaeticus]WPP22846.1 hypothetical protein SCD25_04990 [Komagataeibacter rhaeticus]
MPRTASMPHTSADVEKTARELFEEELGRPWRIGSPVRGPSSDSPLPAATEAEQEAYRQKAREKLSGQAGP